MDLIWLPFTLHRTQFNAYPSSGSLPVLLNNQVDNEVRLGIFAKKKIEKYEELTIDYRWSLSEDSKPTPCLCGSALCRKQIELPARREAEQVPSEPQIPEGTAIGDGGIEEAADTVSAGDAATESVTDADNTEVATMTREMTETQLIQSALREKRPVIGYSRSQKLTLDPAILSDHNEITRDSPFHPGTTSICAGDLVQIRVYDPTSEEMWYLRSVVCRAYGHPNYDRTDYFLLVEQGVTVNASDVVSRVARLVYDPIATVPINLNVFYSSDWQRLGDMQVITSDLFTVAATPSISPEMCRVYDKLWDLVDTSAKQSQQYTSSIEKFDTVVTEKSFCIGIQGHLTTAYTGHYRGSDFQAEKAHDRKRPGPAKKQRPYSLQCWDVVRYHSPRGDTKSDGYGVIVSIDASKSLLTVYPDNRELTGEQLIRRVGRIFCASGETHIYRQPVLAEKGRNYDLIPGTLMRHPKLLLYAAATRDLVISSIEDTQWDDLSEGTYLEACEFGDANPSAYIIVGVPAFREGLDDTSTTEAAISNEPARAISSPTAREPQPADSVSVNTDTDSDLVVGPLRRRAASDTARTKEKGFDQPNEVPVTTEGLTRTEGNVPPDTTPQAGGLLEGAISELKDTGTEVVLAGTQLHETSQPQIQFADDTAAAVHPSPKPTVPSIEIRATGVTAARVDASPKPRSELGILGRGVTSSGGHMEKSTASVSLGEQGVVVHLEHPSGIKAATTSADENITRRPETSSRKPSNSPSRTQLPPDSSNVSTPSSVKSWKSFRPRLSSTQSTNAFLADIKDLESANVQHNAVTDVSTVGKYGLKFHFRFDRKSYGCFVPGSRHNFVEIARFFQSFLHHETSTGADNLQYLHLNGAGILDSVHEWSLQSRRVLRLLHKYVYQQCLEDLRQVRLTICSANYLPVDSEIQVKTACVVYGGTNGDQWCRRDFPAGALCWHLIYCLGTNCLVGVVNESDGVLRENVHRLVTGEALMIQGGLPYRYLATAGTVDASARLHVTLVSELETEISPSVGVVDLFQVDPIWQEIPLRFFLDTTSRNHAFFAQVAEHIKLKKGQVFVSHCQSTLDTDHKDLVEELQELPVVIDLTMSRQLDFLSIPDITDRQILHDFLGGNTFEWGRRRFNSWYCGGTIAKYQVMEHGEPQHPSGVSSMMVRVYVVDGSVRGTSYAMETADDNSTNHTWFHCFCDVELSKFLGKENYVECGHFPGKTCVGLYQELCSYVTNALRHHVSSPYYRGYSVWEFAKFCVKEHSITGRINMCSGVTDVHGIDGDHLIPSVMWQDASQAVERWILPYMRRAHDEWHKVELQEHVGLVGEMLGDDDMEMVDHGHEAFESTSNTNTVAGTNVRDGAPVDTVNLPSPAAENPDNSEYGRYVVGTIDLTQSPDESLSSRRRQERAALQGVGGKELSEPLSKSPVREKKRKASETADAEGSLRESLHEPTGSTTKRKKAASTSGTTARLDVRREPSLAAVTGVTPPVEAPPLWSATPQLEDSLWWIQDLTRIKGWETLLGKLNEDAEIQFAKEKKTMIVGKVLQQHHIGKTSYLEHHGLVDKTDLDLLKAYVTNHISKTIADNQPYWDWSYLRDYAKRSRELAQEPHCDYEWDKLNRDESEIPWIMVMPLTAEGCKLNLWDKVRDRSGKETFREIMRCTGLIIEYGTALYLRGDVVHGATGSVALEGDSSHHCHNRIHVYLPHRLSDWDNPTINRKFVTKPTEKSKHFSDWCKLWGE